MLFGAQLEYYQKITIDQVKTKLKKGIEIRSRYKFPLYRQQVFKVMFQKQIKITKP